MVSLNNTVSCGTIPIDARSEDCVTFRISWPSIKDLAAGDVIETKQQPRNGSICRRRTGHNRDRLAGRHFETETLQDWTLGIVRKIAHRRKRTLPVVTINGLALGTSLISGFRDSTLNIFSMSITACLISR